MRFHVVSSFLESYKISWNRSMNNDSDGLMKSRRGVFGSNLSSAFVSLMIGSVYFTTLMLIVLKDATPIKYGYFIALNAAVQNIAGMVQFVAPFFIERLKKRRAAVYWLAGVNYFINIVLLPLVVLLPVSVSAKGYLFVGLVGVMTATGSVSGLAWSVWSIHSLPMSCRSDYLLVYRGVYDVVIQLLTLVLGLFMDYFNANEMAFAGILAMRGVALMLVGLEYYFRHRTVEPEYNAGQERIRLRDIVRTPFTSAKFMRTVLVAAVWTFGTGIAGLYYTPYLLDGVGLSYSYMSLCGIVGMPLTLIMAPFWNRLVRRWGWVKAMPLSFFLYAIAYAFNGLVTAETPWMYMVSSVFCMLVCGGYSLEMENLPYLYLPEKMGLSCLAFYRLCGSLSGLAAAAVGNWCYGLTLGKDVHLFGLILENRAYMSLIGFGILVVACIMAGFIDREKKSALGRSC